MVSYNYVYLGKNKKRTRWRYVSQESNIINKLWNESNTERNEIQRHGGVLRNLGEVMRMYWKYCYDEY